MLDYQGTGESVMEMSHRSKEYQAIIDKCEELFRQVLSIPKNYKVLFLQGGASSQFAMIPLNLMNKSGKADFVITGQWATKAYQEAQTHLQRMRTISIFVITTQFMEPASMIFPRPGIYRW